MARFKPIRVRRDKKRAGTSDSVASFSSVFSDQISLRAPNLSLIFQCISTNELTRIGLNHATGCNSSNSPAKG